MLIAGADSLERHPELFDKHLLGRYYSEARLASGRERWLEPDLHPLGLPSPRHAETILDLPSLLRRIPAAVAVLATRSERTVHATTVSSLTSVSKDPPLVSVCLDNQSRSLALLRQANAFTLSVLASHQRNLAEHFAEPERPGGRAQFAGIAHHLNPYGPLFDSAAGWIGCDVHAVHECGDHHIIIGHVRLADTTDEHPLLRHNSAYQ